MAGQISLHLLLRQENIFTKSYMMGSEMLLAGSIFLLTLVLVIWQPRGLSIDWSASIGAVLALGTGVIHISDIPVVWNIVWNPACGTSRNTLEMIRNSGNEPTIIYYLDTPPTRDELIKLISDMGITVRALLRKNVEPYEHLGLDEEKFSDEQLIDFMLQHPILINRPVVVTPLGTRLCRPSEIVLDILPEGQKGAFTKEDGEKIIDETGKRVK